MNIEIGGLLLERLTALASSLRTDSLPLAHEVLRQGLEHMEQKAEAEAVRTRASVSGSAVYVREHWKEQSDAAMASALGLKVSSVIMIRFRYGLRRRGPRIASPVIGSISNGAVAGQDSTPSASLPLAQSLRDEAKTGSRGAP